MLIQIQKYVDMRLRALPAFSSHCALERLACGSLFNCSWTCIGNAGKVLSLVFELSYDGY